MQGTKADDLAQKFFFIRGSQSCFTSLRESTFHSLSCISSGFAGCISYLFAKPADHKGENIMSVAEQ